jgi:UDP-N-acetylmuramoyl-tripeptide--D-alanyl-D-alanine ligase
MYLSKQFFMAIVPEAQWHGPDFPENFQLVVDSRTITAPNDLPQLFVALKGACHDGNSFVQDALTRGACGVITTNNIPKDIPAQSIYITVPDVLDAVVSVAKAWRARIPFPIVGITGSVGKTSTKQLLGDILKNAGKRVLIAQGNQNTALGISLNLWRLRQDHEVALFEMGISKKGEMARMADIVRPTLAMITYIGHSHSEGLGSCLDVAVEKRAIFSYFDERAIGIIQGDQPELSANAYSHPIIKFGKKMTHQIQLRKVVVNSDHITCVLKIYHEKYSLSVPTTNTAFLNCMLAASAAAHALGIKHQVIIDTVQRPLIVAGRFEKKVLPSNLGMLIHDAYNASPESMKSALLAFEKIEAKNKVAILGDMLELGDSSGFWHRQIGRFLKKVPSLSQLILVGTQVNGIQKTAPLGLSCILVSTWQEAVAAVRPLLGADTAVLVKASRGIALNKLVDVLEKNS